MAASNLHIAQAEGCAARRSRSGRDGKGCVHLPALQGRGIIRGPNGRDVEREGLHPRRYKSKEERWQSAVEVHLEPWRECLLDQVEQKQRPIFDERGIGDVTRLAQHVSEIDTGCSIKWWA